MKSVAGDRLSPENRGCTPGSDNPAGRLAGAVGAKARACAAMVESEAPMGAGSVGAAPAGDEAPAGCLLFHHCWDIWASISSIFLSVTARSSGEVMLVWKNEGRAVWSSDRWPCSASRWRSLRNWSNSRRRTKSLRRLRSIISLSICLLYWLSRSSSMESSSFQLTVGLRTKRTTLDSRPREDSSLLMGGRGWRARASARGRAQKCGKRWIGPVAGPSVAEHLLLHSRRCCASRDRVAVGRARRRPTPMGSPVSSQ